MKTVTRYEVRIIRTGNAFSTSTNFRLYDRKRAMRIVKRLKKSRVDAIAAPMKIAA